ncbi:MAG: 16S rRNA (guanine(527)-N(7))-methyltransferase RsmG [Rhodobacteraceae bacterium PARR1]|nr:MAG: 16S rRNA (guanine(527)-N(7))-methyltransferase RsmG [Rhodobacteraceae bacterium PARR1]
MTAPGIAGLDVSRETFDRLTALSALLQKWNPAINLVAKSTLRETWTRHIVDSAQLYRLAPPQVGHWADLGSGGGFPGLVIAILAAELDVQRHLTLVESDQRKATFLRQAARELGLTQTTVVSERVESILPLSADVLSARALAGLPKLCAFACLHLSPTGLGLFPKGAQHRDEVAQAKQDWRFDLSVFPSDTDPSAVVLAMKAIQHV